MNYHQELETNIERLRKSIANPAFDASYRAMLRQRLIESERALRTEFDPGEKARVELENRDRIRGYDERDLD